MQIGKPQHIQHPKEEEILSCVKNSPKHFGDAQDPYIGYDEAKKIWMDRCKSVCSGANICRVERISVNIAKQLEVLKEFHLRKMLCFE